ncbi:MAG: sigma-54-dependent Fis family transcriptional regulator [bacterium]
MEDKNTDKFSEDLLLLTLKMTISMINQNNLIQLLRNSLDLCKRVLKSDRALLISETQEGNQKILECVGEHDKSYPFSKTALKLVNEKQEPLLISDTIKDEVLGTQESISRNDIRSVLCSRLDTKPDTFGNKQIFLYLDSRSHRHPFSLVDLERFKHLSELTAHFVQKSELLASQEAAIEELKNQVKEKQLEDLVYSSDNFKKCLEIIRQGAPTQVSVLLIGETGTGKEMLARTIHKLSPRDGKPFLAVNCGAIPANLMESQLFGHEKGAFTGAVAMRKGFFEQASGGTLFLDEIGELPLHVQANFLRVLQENEIIRVGSSVTTKVDVRIIAAANIELEKAVSENKFRKDLYYRLAVLPIKIPPVRERGQDALMLARFFLKRYCETFGLKKLQFSREAEKSILFYNWPGNVREIQNRIQRAVITARENTISSSDISLEIDNDPAYSSLREARESVDRKMISQALHRAPGNLTNAAKLLGIDRKSLRLLLEKYEIKIE